MHLAAHVQIVCERIAIVYEKLDIGVMGLRVSRSPHSPGVKRRAAESN